jgi:hypothetical protein
MSKVAPQCGEWNDLPGGIQQTRAAAVNRNGRLMVKERDWIKVWIAPLSKASVAARKAACYAPPMPFGIYSGKLICEMDWFSCVACRGDFVTWQLAPMIFISL